MAILIDHQPVSQPTGTREYGPVTVPSTATQFVIRLARHTTATPQFWPNQTTVVDASLPMSNDGGATWPATGGGFAGAKGGTRLGIKGAEVPEQLLSNTLSLPIGQGNWRIKAVVTVTNGPLDTQLTVEVN